MLHFLIPLLFSCTLLLFQGCGFSIFPSRPDNNDQTAEGFVALGNEQKWDRNYRKALEYYKLATEKDSTYTDGWYLKAEMELRVKGIVLPDLIGELQNENSDKLPFFPDTNQYNHRNDQVDGRTYIDSLGVPQPITVLDTLYNTLVFLFNPAVAAYNDLRHITTGNAYWGNFTRDRILVDFIMLSSLNTALLSLDNQPKDGQLTPDYGPGNRERKLYNTLAGGLKSIDSVNINIDSVKALFDGPDDINRMIDDLVNSAAISLNSILDLDGEIQASTAAGIDKTMMDDPKKNMSTIILKAKFYYYNDKKDNDYDYFDTDNDNKVQREIWIDTSGGDRPKDDPLGDGPGVDKMDWVDPANPSRRINVRNIFRTLRDVAGYLPASGALTEGIDTANKLYDASLFGIRDTAGNPVNLSLQADKYFYFKGPHGGEFVAGDWGVDEEQLDDMDGDGDGIKDEDSRTGNDSLDNDGDFIKIDTLNLAIDNSDASLTLTVGANTYLTVGTGGNSVQSSKIAVQKENSKLVPSGNVFLAAGNRKTARMVWDDVNGDGVVNDPQGGPINYFYARDSAGRISDSINNGRPYGEWIQGDWGVDEEYQDGRDNDLDGKVDEDGDMHRVHKWADAEKTNYMTRLKQFFAIQINIDTCITTLNPVPPYAK